MTSTDNMQQYCAPEKLLQNKVILVTGAGDGIGKAASLSFAEHGATVVLVGRTMAKLEAVYDEIENNGWARPAIIPANFESITTQDFTEIHHVLENEFGVLDGLLHNAGELGPRTPISNYSLDAWQKLMQVNLTAPFELTKALLPLLQKSTSASIVFTGSGVGRHGKAYWGGYAVSKAACENLMQVLADEMDGKPNVRVNSINPGAVSTRMRASAFPAEDPGTLKSPAEVMNAYLFLMGEHSQGINGQQLDAQ